MQSGKLGLVSRDACGIQPTVMMWGKEGSKCIS